MTVTLRSGPPGNGCDNEARKLPNAFYRIELAALGLVLAVDALLRTLPFIVPLTAALDEPAHLATTVILLSPFRRVPRPFLIGALVASVLIDLDHIPIYVGFEPLIAATHRPYTHSLLTIAIVLVAMALVAPKWRAVMGGVAFGLANHFFRDLATGDVPLLWPITMDQLSLPYRIYFFALVLAIAMTLRQNPVLESPLSSANDRP